VCGRTPSAIGSGGSRATWRDVGAAGYVWHPDEEKLMSSAVDAVVVGSGPNGLSAAIALAQAQRSVVVLEASDTIGGGTRTAERTLPGFLHDTCSAVHPMGVLSPFWRTLPLHEHGLEWIEAPVSVAHPLPDGPAAILEQSLDATAEGLGPDADAWKRLLRPFLAHPDRLMEDLLGPLSLFPRQPLVMARFARLGLRSAAGLARRWFEGERARGLFAGCAAHSILPLDKAVTAAVGLVFAATGHIRNWPCAKGGSHAIAKALASHLESLGGEIRTGHRVTTRADLPECKAVLFDLSPKPVVDIAGDDLPAGYRRRLLRFRYGPAAFKVDWALDGPIPWKDEACARASTVHVGGTLDEIAESEDAMWNGRHAERPFLLVCQQSHFDPTRAPAGKHTGYAYCHVPGGSTVDMTERIEAQLERFAPGFRDLVLARHVTTPRDFEAANANYIGGAITGGVTDLGQLFTRPVARLNPYTTPNPKYYFCSASTPPGGGVHGMCGFYAAKAALKRVLR
jgi:phytoene dehydrogenase-like protein